MISTIAGIIMLLFGLYLKWRFHIQFVLIIHKLVKLYRWTKKKYIERQSNGIRTE